MRRIAAGVGLLLSLVFVTSIIVAAAPAAKPAPKPADVVNIQLLTISDWHGQLVPSNGIGGAAFLKTYLDQARTENPNTLAFMAGDSIGATPPISSFFEDEPAIKTMNMMGISADTFGNHNFDRGVSHLQEMVDLADFPFVAANLKHLKQNLKGVKSMRIFEVAKVRIAVIGIMNEEAPTLVSPGALGTIEITDSIDAANRAARAARRGPHRADVVVILTHKGIRGRDADGAAFGELIDFANGVDPKLVDVVVGDHTDFSYTGLHQDSVLAVENLSKGMQFSKIQLQVDRKKGDVLSKSVTQHVPTNAGVTPDPAIQAYLDDLNTQLSPILGTVIGSATRAIPRSDQCGRADGRLCESLVGNVVTDALRTAYGADFAITNSGGLRAALTCPEAGVAGFCPSGTTGNPVTRGSVLGVLPFGNVSVTLQATGAEIKAFLENGVSQMPAANGRFAQVSGLCFTYDIASPAGSRVTSVVRQAADGTCTGGAVDLSSSATYLLATNDFVAKAGDGYPDVYAKATTRNIMDEDLAAYMTANPGLSPAIQGRIVCADSNGATAPNCPAITSP